MRAALAVALLVVAASVALGCGPAPHTRGAGAVSPLSVRSVAWNPTNAPVGNVRAVADDGDVVAVFSDLGATVFSARAAVAMDRSIINWASAATIAGADGAARWIVGVSGSGRLYHLRGLSAFEDVTDRYGLAGRVLGATPLGTGLVGFLLGREIAIADGAHVTRYDTAATNGVTFAELAGGAGYGAGIAANDLNVFEVSLRTMSRYPLAGVTHAAFGPDGRLYAATRRGIYALDAQGRLALVYDASADSIHGLVASGADVWFADGDELGLVTGDRVAETSGAKIGPDAALSGSSSGDVWVVAGGGRALSRFTRAERATNPVSSWETSIAPIFARSCATCHLPDGVSGTDLSTNAAWEVERAKIRARVVEERSMPPDGHPLSEADRRAIRMWVEGGVALPVTRAP